MNRDAKATHLSRGLQVVADEIVLGGGCAVEQRPGEPAHAQEQVGEAQVEKRANLGKVKLVSRSGFLPLCLLLCHHPALITLSATSNVPGSKSSIKPYKHVDDGVICSLAE